MELALLRGPSAVSSRKAEDLEAKLVAVGFFRGASGTVCAEALERLGPYSERFPAFEGEGG